MNRRLALCRLRRLSLAAEILGCIYAAGPFVRRHLRIRTERSRAVDDGFGRMRRDDPGRRVAGLHPLLELADGVEGIRSLAAAAMVHARLHVELNRLASR